MLSMRPIFLFLLILWICPKMEAQNAEIAPVDRDVIETRIKQCKRKNDDRKDILRELLERAGCPQLTEQPIKGFKYPNVICTSPGSTESVIIVGAHYDHSTAYGLGVIDNWSGAALLPSLLQSLQNTPRKHTYLFIGFAGEENGLVGSRFFVKQMTEEQKQQIRAMVNLDCVGLSSTKVEVNRGNPKLIQLLFTVAKALKAPLGGVNVDRVGMTDAYSFMDAKVPAVSIHSLTQESLRVLHGTSDQMDSVQMKDYYETFQLVAFYLAALDEMLPD